MVFGDGDPVTLPWWVTAFSIAAVPIAGWIGTAWRTWRDGKRQDIQTHIVYLTDALEMYKSDNLRIRNLANELLETVTCHHRDFRICREGMVSLHAKVELFRAGWERANAVLSRHAETAENVETIPPMPKLEACDVSEFEYRSRTAQANAAVTMAVSDTIRTKPPSSTPPLAKGAAT